MPRVTYHAADRKAGMTPAEIRRAVHELDNDADVTVEVTWRGRVTSITTHTQGEEQ